MALSDRSRESLLPSFLYSSAARSFTAASAGAARLPVSAPAPGRRSGWRADLDPGAQGEDRDVLAGVLRSLYRRRDC
ncbi:hypothetical protein PR202_ga02869 [Eleusine coracana subsp. coracana]|uniref:Uncharacterized protein n=1 Tax=Eleusine coracana subsp. coracana TaxID=191504 RepID=A0AAV5BMT7_ELECO|nr:hypothetical protein PR202_ga02869 [Eleusine coracana subsp. coracana]